MIFITRQGKREIVKEFLLFEIMASTSTTLPYDVSQCDDGDYEMFAYKKIS